MCSNENPKQPYSDLTPFPLEHVEILSFSFSLYLKNACGKNSPCRNNAICQSGFTNKGYKCLCNPGFEGEQCEGTPIIVNVIEIACSVRMGKTFFCRFMRTAGEVHKPAQKE